VPESYHLRLAATDGTTSGHEGCKNPKGIPINELVLRDVFTPSYPRGLRLPLFEQTSFRVW
jgi:hypothetical protein